METLKVILAWVLVILFIPLWATFAFIEAILFVNNDATKDINMSYKVAEGFVSYKIFKWFVLDKLGL